jgi:PAB1-binding protein PBP1
LVVQGCTIISNSYICRSWDQFETNAALFGVKSTFNEEIYTTKLERGPHMRELEKHASRIAREIEGEDTKDIHLAEVGLGSHFCFWSQCCKYSED